MIVGKSIYSLAEKLFPICRSITGNGVRQSLNILKEIYDNMNIYEVPTGTKVFDWTVPREWNIHDAYIVDESGNKIVDFKNNNLHVVGYSIPVNRLFSLEELQNYLYSLPEQPALIPYMTSYYKEQFGFCISHNQRLSLLEGNYHVVIDSELKHGSLTYGEIIVPGKTNKEVFLSTYICHPSLANNELSGPCLAIFLARYIAEMKERHYTYRIVFVPETIGSITYLSKNLDILKENVIAGFNITCVGDNNSFSYLPSRYGNTMADKVAINFLQTYQPGYKVYSFLDRGSDERQYCAPGVDLPLCSIMRTKYGEYPEYHTSADNLSFISPQGLQGSYEVYTNCINALEHNKVYQANCLCEPQLGPRGLYPLLSFKGSTSSIKPLMDFLAYADGTNDLIDISNIIKVSVSELIQIALKLNQFGLVCIVK